ncbi:MAG: hypothetical protein K9G47_09745 [Bacteroidales bacterium]|nr:hypothetical protein [Bacteroidales bacterium]
MNRKQFLLAKYQVFNPNLTKVQTIGDYDLFLGMESEYNFIKQKDIELHLIGTIYDWKAPQSLENDLLGNLIKCKTISVIIEMSNQYCGEFILIVKFKNELFIFNDATGQKELYYDNNFTTFGSQPKLLGSSIELLEHTSEKATTYYQSITFTNKHLFVGNTTHKKNIFHLLPNHLININKRCIERFFPTAALQKKPLKIVASESAKMLQGYISAIAKRHKIKMAVTAGYDSRVLFLASLGCKCKYFVYKHPFMSDTHYDIVIPKRLTSYYNKRFTVEEKNESSKKLVNRDYLNDIDFPRPLDISTKDIDHIFINGNISEIARNYFGYLKNASAKDLCFLTGNSTLSFPVEQYSNWLKNKATFKKYGYNYLDMFYWEEKMGNWAAKSKTENHAIGRDIISPFNSRELLNLLLGTKRINRDSHFNKLYDLIISKLADDKKEIVKMPINPSKKQAVIRFMKFLRIYNLYWLIGIKTRILKV